MLRRNFLAGLVLSPISFLFGSKAKAMIPNEEFYSNFTWCEYDCHWQIALTHITLKQKKYFSGLWPAYSFYEKFKTPQEKRRRIIDVYIKESGDIKGEIEAIYIKDKGAVYLSNTLHLGKYKTLRWNTDKKDWC